MLSQAQTVFDTIIADTILDDYRSLGLVTVYDSRDEQYYPRSGTNAELRADLIPEWLGNDLTGSKLMTTINYYTPNRDHEDVIALRAMFGTGLGADLPFAYEFIVGKGRDLRGYTQGEYRGNGMTALQGEYRLHIGGPWGAVAFTGIATVFGSATPEQNGLLLPTIGLGVRYLVFTENSMNIGFDGAVGRNDWGVYFMIGEAF